MKALYWTEGTKVEVIDAQEPSVQPGMIKVKIHYASICASDVSLVESKKYGVSPPHALGHECCGTVVELGSDTEKYGYNVGDRVAVSSMTACGYCDNCKRGNDVWCENPFYQPRFAEYGLFKPPMLYKIPENADDILPYCLLEPCSSAMRGVDLSAVKLGDNIAIFGTGGIGLIILNLLLLSGGTKVTVIEPGEEKRKRALAMGADYVVDPASEDVVARLQEINPRGYDVVFEVSGTDSAARAALEVMAIRGTIVYYAMYPVDYILPLSLHKIQRKELRIQTVMNTSLINNSRVMDIIPKLQMDKLIGIVLPLSEGAKAWDLFKQSIYPKIVLKCFK